VAHRTRAQMSVPSVQNFTCSCKRESMRSVAPVQLCKEHTCHQPLKALAQHFQVDALDRPFAACQEMQRGLQAGWRPKFQTC
jgi:hypothetical protein